jgi:hypothetical protein
VGLAAEAAHAARRTLRAPLREDQLKRRETRLLECESLCCPFAALAFAWSAQRRLRIQWGNPWEFKSPLAHQQKISRMQTPEGPVRRRGLDGPSNCPNRPFRWWRGTPPAVGSSPRLEMRWARRAIHPVSPAVVEFCPAMHSRDVGALVDTHLAPSCPSSMPFAPGQCLAALVSNERGR